MKGTINFFQRHTIFKEGTKARIFFKGTKARNSQQGTKARRARIGTQFSIIKFSYIILRNFTESHQDFFLVFHYW